jgi:adenosylcobinamide-phosphate synthase
VAFSPLDLLLAWAADAALGDPVWIPWPHPVVIVGRAAHRLDRFLRRPRLSTWQLVARGIAFWALLVGGFAAAGWAVLAICRAVHPLLERMAGIYLAYACLATRSLDAEAREVAHALDRRDIPLARERLARIVGRDTEGLDEAEVSRGAVETVAENASDGVVAPLFYLGLGGLLGLGPLLGLSYKVVNTLDSTVGYRDERYEHFGKFAARADDAANWLPARITALLSAGVAQILWRRGGEATRIAARDGRLHKSPNAGYPEAAFAGALGVQLGGTNTYRGVPRPSPRLGDPGTALSASQVRRALHLLWGVSAGALILAMAALGS